MSRSASLDNEPGLDSSTVRWIQTHLDWVTGLPHPDKQWTVTHVDVNHKHLPTLRKSGIIRVVGRKQTDVEGRFDQVNIYKTTRVAHERITEYVENRDAGHVWTPCPCPETHTGVSNLGNGEYTCGKESCDRTYSRDELDL